MYLQNCVRRVSKIQSNLEPLFFHPLSNGVYNPLRGVRRELGQWVEGTQYLPAPSSAQQRLWNEGVMTEP